MTRFLCLLAAGFGLSSCLRGGQDNCSATILEPAQAVSGPKTIAVNQTASFLITYLPQTTCGKLASLYEAAGSLPNTRIIGPQVQYSDCNCPTNTVVAQATYTFKPTTPGTYYLSFVSTNAGGFITDTLVVQ
jgi:hypothetical protein